MVPPFWVSGTGVLCPEADASTTLGTPPLTQPTYMSAPAMSPAELRPRPAQPVTLALTVKVMADPFTLHAMDMTLEGVVYDGRVDATGGVPATVGAGVVGGTVATLPLPLARKLIETML